MLSVFKKMIKKIVTTLVRSVVQPLCHPSLCHPLKKKAVYLLSKLTRWSPRHPFVMAVHILALVAEGLEQHSPNRLAASVYQQLPSSWVAPQGVATQDECLHVIRYAVRLMKALRQLTLH